MSTQTTDTLRARLAAAAEGVVYVSESEAPFTPVAMAAAGSNALGVGEVRRHFVLPANASIAERSLDDFFRPLVDDVDPADAAAQAAVPRARALRELIRTMAPGARAFRVGDGPEVRYLVVGWAAAAAGALVGVETVGYES